MESTLTLSRKEIENKVGIFLGWGAGEDFGERAWTTRQAREIRDCVESGLRRFYYPSPELTRGQSITWSFLHPMANLTLDSGQRTINLPGNFGGVDTEEVIVTDSSNRLYMPIRIEGPGKIETLYASNPSGTGRPQVAAIVPLRGVNHDRGQQFQLQVYPEPDSEYILKLHYFFLPNYPDGTEAYAYGGSEHTETILESCLAVAEERRDNRQGVHALAFQRCLSASVQLDRKKKPQRIGYNGDNSDNLCGYDRRDTAAAVTINGTVYD